MGDVFTHTRLLLHMRCHGLTGSHTPSPLESASVTLDHNPLDCLWAGHLRSSLSPPVHEDGLCADTPSSLPLLPHMIATEPGLPAILPF